MSQAFNQAAFEAAFATSLINLASSEKITRAELSTLSRSVMEAVHSTGNIVYVNKLMLVLTPVNKKVAKAFFEHFVGFTFDDAKMEFTVKAKKRYDAALALSNEFLEDPHNNIWSWAERHIEVAKKDFDISQVTEAIKGFEKKAKKNGLTQKDVIKAVLQAGVELETILELMAEMYDVDTEESKIVQFERAKAGE